MTFAQAMAILVIALFAGFTLWGRSARGRTTLTRLYGSPVHKDTNPPGRRTSAGAARSERKTEKRRPTRRAAASARRK